MVPENQLRFRMYSSLHVPIQRKRGTLQICPCEGKHNPAVASTDVLNPFARGLLQGWMNPFPESTPLHYMSLATMENTHTRARARTHYTSHTHTHSTHSRHISLHSLSLTSDTHTHWSDSVHTDTHTHTSLTQFSTPK